jgi:SAM-dependent methyltransferase
MRRHAGGEGARASAAPAEEWDARYSERQVMWSGRPNGRLVREVAGLTAGSALDVGCGEGADAIWLATQGWTVTGIDVSAVAINRAREAAARARVQVEWMCGDVLETALPTRSLDLVSMQYPALLKAPGQKGLHGLLAALRPGGLLLAVYHDLGGDQREHMRSRGIDPDDYLDADILVQALGNGFILERHVLEPRVDPPPDTPHVADVVVRARRR